MSLLGRDSLASLHGCDSATAEKTRRMLSSAPPERLLYSDTEDERQSQLARIKRNNIALEVAAVPDVAGDGLDGATESGGLGISERPRSDEEAEIDGGAQGD